MVLPGTADERFGGYPEEVAKWPRVANMQVKHCLPYDYYRTIGHYAMAENQCCGLVWTVLDSVG
jgi:hypothetical protein